MMDTDLYNLYEVNTQNSCSQAFLHTAYRVSGAENYCKDHTLQLIL